MAMPYYHVWNETRDRSLGDRIRRADSMGARFIGLLGRRCLDPGEGLLLVPCNAVHMFFMRFPIDVVFLDEALTIVALSEGLRPFRWTPIQRGARSALELPEGTLRGTGTRIGDRLRIGR